MHCMRRGPGVVHLGDTDPANRAQHARRAWCPRWGLAPQPLSGGWYPAGAQSKNRPNARAEAMQCVWVVMLGVGRGSVAHGGLERAAWPLRSGQSEYTGTVFGAVGDTLRTRPTEAF